MPEVGVQDGLFSSEVNQLEVFDIKEFIKKVPHGLLKVLIHKY